MSACGLSLLYQQETSGGHRVLKKKNPGSPIALTWGGGGMAIEKPEIYRGERGSERPPRDPRQACGDPNGTKNELVRCWCGILCASTSS